MDGSTLNREQSTDIKGKDAAALSPNELHNFFIEFLTYDPKTDSQRNSVSLKDLNEYQKFTLTTAHERTAIRQLKRDFSTIKDMSNDQWGTETKITLQDMKVLAQNGLPDTNQRIKDAQSWNSLSDAIYSDPDYFTLRSNAVRLRSRFEANRELIDRNGDHEVSPRELRLFENDENQSDNGKELARALRENFKTLSQDSDSIPETMLVHLGLKVDPVHARIHGILSGAQKAFYTGPITTIASMAAIGGAVEGAKALFPSAAKLTPPARLPWVIGAVVGLGTIIHEDFCEFGRFKSQYAKLMPMLSNLRFER